MEGPGRAEDHLVQSRAPAASLARALLLLRQNQALILRQNLVLELDRMLLRLHRGSALLSDLTGEVNDRAVHAQRKDIMREGPRVHLWDPCV